MIKHLFSVALFFILFSCNKASQESKKETLKINTLSNAPYGGNPDGTYATTEIVSIGNNQWKTTSNYDGLDLIFSNVELRYGYAWGKLIQAKIFGNTGSSYLNITAGSDEMSRMFGVEVPGCQVITNKYNSTFMDTSMDGFTTALKSGGFVTATSHFSTPTPLDLITKIDPENPTISYKIIHIDYSLDCGSINLYTFKLMAKKESDNIVHYYVTNQKYNESKTIPQPTEIY